MDCYVPGFDFFLYLPGKSLQGVYDGFYRMIRFPGILFRF
jgi:hypothetical protein